jgi:hypothetical protein
MNEAKLTVIGVYRPHITDEIWQQQWETTEDDDFTREHFEKLVLIEAVVEGLDSPFLMIELGQMQPQFPDDVSRKMVGYDEGLLRGDGESLIARDTDCVRGDGPLRFAVYLHLYDPNRPLQWQGGEVICPEVQDVPIRLAMLMPYTPL